MTAEESLKLAAAAERLGTSTSELIRDAVMARCDAVLAEDFGTLLDDIMGAVEGDGKGPWARDSEAVFGEIVAEKLAKRPGSFGGKLSFRLLP